MANRQLRKSFIKIFKEFLPGYQFVYLEKFSRYELDVANKPWNEKKCYFILKYDVTICENIVMIFNREDFSKFRISSPKDEIKKMLSILVSGTNECFLCKKTNLNLVSYCTHCRGIGMCTPCIRQLDDVKCPVCEEPILIVTVTEKN